MDKRIIMHSTNKIVLLESYKIYNTMLQEMNNKVLRINNSSLTITNLHQFQSVSTSKVFLFYFV
jgi:hypothetical protein